MIRRSWLPRLEAGKAAEAKGAEAREAGESVAEVLLGSVPQAGAGPRPKDSRVLFRDVSKG